IPSPPWWLILLFFLFGACACIALRLDSRSARSSFTISLSAVLCAAFVIAIHPFHPDLRKGSFELTILDVGQGDSLFLESPTGHTMLIDGGGQAPNYSGHAITRGPDPGEEAVSPFLWSRGLKRIDVVAITHAHQDHLGGIPAILQNFQVGELWIGRDVQS